jgi:hypothetical protein
MSNSYKGQVFYTDCSSYYNFLKVFGDEHTFQTFDDRGKNRKLIKQFHGTIKEHFHELAELNKQGAGIFFSVNETDLLGRSSRNITKVRALFIDLDGTPLPKTWELLPHVVTNTSPGKYHAYWLVEDVPLVSFSLFQESLANKFKSDPKVKDLPRIMRVAGFYHCKKKPYPVTIHQIASRIEPYTRADIKNSLGLKRPEQKVYTFEKSEYKGKYSGNFKYGASKGDRHEQLIKILIAIRKRGESFEYAKEEALEFARNCNPPESPREVMFQLKDIWRRYVPA